MFEAQQEDVLLKIAASVVTDAIRSGAIDVRGKSDEEANASIAAWIEDFLGRAEEDPRAVDTERPASLEDEAARYRRAGRYDFALMMSATQIEHWVNHMVLWASVNRRGLEEDEATSIIQEADLASKTGGLWLLLMGEEFPADLAARIDRIDDHRNAFVRDQWEIDQDPTTAALAEDANALMAELKDLEYRIVSHAKRDALTWAVRRPRTSWAAQHWS